MWRRGEDVVCDRKKQDGGDSVWFAPEWKWNKGE